VDAGLKKEAALRLKVAAGHLESVRRMVDQESYCIDIMKQIAAVQSSLEQVQLIVLRNHLLTCVADAVRRGFGPTLIDELMEALKYTPLSAAEVVAPNQPLSPLMDRAIACPHDVSEP
jgi:DNA-binding FrmR family transcriptional regulator